MSVKVAGEYVSLSPRTIYNALCEKAEKPFPVKPLRYGKRILFGKRDLDRWIDSLSNRGKDQFISDVRAASAKIGLTYGRKVKDGFTPHSLRHTFKTNAMRANVSQAIRMKISGHSTPEMDDRYVHPQLEDLRTAMEKINRFIKNGEAKPDGQTPPSSHGDFGRSESNFQKC